MKLISECVLAILALFLLVPIVATLMSLSLKEFSKDEICYRGFTYVRMDRSYSPVFNIYGMPKRCKLDNEDN